MSSAAVTFACVGFGLLVAHQIRDHWVQTHYQAARKGLPGRIGRMACIAHVSSYTIVTSATVGLLWVVLDLDISSLGFLAGQLVSAVTHYWSGDPAVRTVSGPGRSAMPARGHGPTPSKEKIHCEHYPLRLA